MGGTVEMKDPATPLSWGESRKRKLKMDGLGRRAPAKVGTCCPLVSRSHEQSLGSSM